MKTLHQTNKQTGKKVISIITNDGKYKKQALQYIAELENNNFQLWFSCVEGLNLWQVYQEK